MEKQIDEISLGKEAIKALKNLADDEDLEAILFLCKKNINRNKYLQKLEIMLKMEEGNTTAKRHIAKTIYEITGNKIKEVHSEAFKQVNFDR